MDLRGLLVSTSLSWSCKLRGHVTAGAEASARAEADAPEELKPEQQEALGAASTQQALVRRV